ncbi:glycosyltransferase [uncultured Desulfobulbus sp.]|uniref:glycosyltransferase n=1 Tax=uncultured Desulfobulbus sp. TaxID=239745 RepID=UPI0029C866CE|nr:glycosyltransferase [uncultured Desulfobulbus sp.]
MPCKMKKCHVMHVVDSLEVGGMENGVVNLANHIDKERFIFSVCCLSHPGNMSKRITDKGVTVFCLNWRGGFTLGLFWKIYQAMKERKVNIVHTHGWLTLLYCSVPSVLLRTILVNGEHGLFYLEKFRRLIAYKIISLAVEKYVPVSYSLEKELLRILKIDKNKIVTIPNGVDLQAFSPLTREEIATVKQELSIPASVSLIGSVGRLEPVKNFAMLLRVFANLSKNNNNLHCILIGDGSLRRELEVLATELGVEGKVHFTGKISNPYQVTPLLDIFVSTSLSEGMSNTILEAMACGIPIVATNVGDNSRLVQDGKNGFLVNPENAILLEKAIHLLLSDDVKRKAFGIISREIVENKFDIMNMIAKYQDIYIKILFKKGYFNDL